MCFIIFISSFAYIYFVAAAAEGEREMEKEQFAVYANFIGICRFSCFTLLLLLMYSV